MHFNEKRIVLPPHSNRHNLRRSSSSNLHIKDSLCYWLSRYTIRQHVCAGSAEKMNDSSYYILIATVSITGILVGCFGLLFLMVCLPWRRCCSHKPHTPDGHRHELETGQQITPPPYYECWDEELPPAYKDVQLFRTEACNSNSSQEHVDCTSVNGENETATPCSLPPEYDSAECTGDMGDFDAD
ncbi:hypothetical protein P879_06107 [Paragonimus westermani]|uniref:Uncharacterized protein n=1 Tax=Paragonimus westermani TaxID=34504 RepID=A0A8T0DJN7_9TREM|nr:hypothetical protein P879_06107 [Paragonimus westermani]